MKSLRNRTQQLGVRTRKHTEKNTRLTVSGKDPKFDYCFRPKSDINEGGGVDYMGWTPVCAENNVGEKYGLPFLQNVKSKGTGQIAYFDTLLCKRPKETSYWLKQQEDQKYNAQQRMIMTGTKNAQLSLRKINKEYMANAIVMENSVGLKAMFDPRRCQPVEENYEADPETTLQKQEG